MTQRCPWVPLGDPLYISYHDEEWGVPVHDDRRLFEMLTLEGAQAGLSWSTILKRRDGYRYVFDDFDPRKVAAYDEEKISSLLSDERIIRNRMKVHSAINNARAFVQVQQEFGTYGADSYIWQFVGGKPKVNCPTTLAGLPAETAESRAMSKDLKRRGFSFVGPTVCYAFMQACGLVDDHTVDCFKALCHGG